MINMNREIEIVYPGELRKMLALVSELEPLDLLEQIFAWFNAGSGNECDEFKRSRMRSLSVNDFVRVNDEWYQCASYGWVPVSAALVAEIETAVRNHPLCSESAWCALDRVMSQRQREPAAV